VLLVRIASRLPLAWIRRRALRIGFQIPLHELILPVIRLWAEPLNIDSTSPATMTYLPEWAINVPVPPKRKGEEPNVVKTKRRFLAPANGGWARPPLGAPVNLTYSLGNFDRTR
jgi:hypothetical protein